MLNLLGNIFLGKQREYLKTLKIKIILFLFYTLTLALIVGCSATAPVKVTNISALYRVPVLQDQLTPLADKSKPLDQKPLPEAVQNLFKKLYALNTNIALEVGKLPEFQCDIGEIQAQDLTKFTELFENATDKQKANLAKLIKVGKPNFRRYCTSLQAIFWILERDKPRKKPTIQEIEYFQLAKIDNKPCINPFDYLLEELLAQAWDFSEQDRWKDYEIVTDRLNSPELVNYYERARFIYKSRKGEIDYDNDYSKRLFNTNRGNCTDHGSFTGYCLKKGGHKTNGHYNVGHHIVCFFKDNGKKYILDNGRPDKFFRRGIIPFEEYEMYHDQKYTKKVGNVKHKDPIFWIQDNYALTLIYLIENKNRTTSIKTISEDLGTPRYASHVRQAIKTLIKFGLISITPYKDNKIEDFTYKINERLCRRFMKERYDKQQNEYPWIDGVNRGYYSSLK